MRLVERSVSLSTCLKHTRLQIAAFAATGSVRWTIMDEKGFPNLMENRLAQTIFVVVLRTPWLSSKKSWTWALEDGLKEVGIPWMIIGKTLCFNTNCGSMLLTQASDSRAITALRLAWSVRWSWISPVKLFFVIPRNEIVGSEVPYLAAWWRRPLLRAKVALVARSLALEESLTKLNPFLNSWERMCGGSDYSHSPLIENSFNRSTLSSNQFSPLISLFFFFFSGQFWSSSVFWQFNITSSFLSITY